MSKMKPTQNAIILSGETYIAKRINYIPGLSPIPCDKCAIRSRCEKEDLQTCRIFNKGSRLAYFKKNIQP